MRELVPDLPDDAQIVPDSFANETKAVGSRNTTGERPHGLIVAEQLLNLFLVVNHESCQDIGEHGIQESRANDSDGPLVYVSTFIEKLMKLNQRVVSLPISLKFLG
jgi:hypothetical protein